MPLYSFVCDMCSTEFSESKPMSKSEETVNCPWCNIAARKVYGCNISGTRDSFGIRKSFVDKKTGKVIDNWKTWEKAGYKDANELVKTMPDRNGDKNFIQQRMKEKTDKIKSKSRITAGVK